MNQFFEYIYSINVKQKQVLYFSLALNHHDKFFIKHAC